MATTVPQVIARFKADVGQALLASAIEQACADLKHSYRKRLLDPATTLHVFLTQILHGNTACTELPHLTGIPFSAPAYAKARSRSPFHSSERSSTA